VTFASLGVDCAKSNAVLAVVNGHNFPATADIVWTATPVNPTATLDDDRNPDLPKTVSADASYTYKDSYTCPADPAIYSKGPVTYNRDNKATLTFATGSVSSTASTSVKCDAYMPSLKFEKTADPLTYSLLGDVIHYSYLVKNTGNVDFAGPVSVTDDKAKVTCPTGGLAIGKSMTCTADYTITAADVEYGLVKNVAFASANNTNSNSDDETVALVKLPQVITVTTQAPASAAYLSSFSVAASGGASGNPIVYSASGTCENVGPVFTMTASSGRCVVHYNQAGNASYEAAAEVTETVNATKVTQTITFTSTVPVEAVYGGAIYTPLATASSGLPVTITVDAAASQVCSISNSVVSFIGVGTCVLDANQPGNAFYDDAAQVQQSFSVAKAPTTIAITNAAALATSSMVGKAYLVTFTITPGTSGTPTGEVTISDGTDSCVVAAAAGMCYLTSTTVGDKLITATYAGDNNFIGSVSLAIPHTVIEAPVVSNWLYLPLILR
jgi:uncharacterized repeat protein (TIGR01451 family)